MPTVALFCSRFLAYSQTFIHEEIRHHERYDVEVFCRGRLNHDLFSFEPVHVGGGLYGYTRVSGRFDRLFASRRYDVVHAHFGTVAVSALRYAQKFRKPLVVTFHGWDVPLLKSHKRFQPKHWGTAFMGRSVLRNLTLGLCASRELLHMVRDLGVPEERLRLHHLGIDPSRFGPGVRDTEAPRLIMIGRFVEKKGFEYGIRAFARATGGTNARLTLVGGGRLERRLRALAHSLGIARRVEFAGVLSSDQVAGRLRESDVLLAPSVVARDGDRESGLMVVKEASASEVVPVGTRHGGIPEIIDDGVTGFLVPERDVDAMANCVARLLAEPNLRARMGRAARAKMEREYDNHERVAALEGHYDVASQQYRDDAVHLRDVHGFDDTLHSDRTKKETD